MLFRRRTRESLWQRFRVHMWPRRSLSRSLQYFWKRILRLRATPHAIAAGVRLIAGNDFEGREKKIDISGDGRSNAGPPPGIVKLLAVKSGITINGLAILTDDAGLAEYYAGEVSGGPGAFTVSASSYRDFAAAFARKLYRELLPRTAGREGSGGLAMGER